MVLACVGLFGVASGAVEQRRTEFGVRVALGADRWSLVRTALRGTAVTFGSGLAVGLVSAVAVVHLLAAAVSDLLTGIAPTDALNIAFAVLLMICVGVVTCIAPAYQATNVDSLEVIRYE